MAKDEIGGVWRTVGGRRIFIKDGEDLETAMKNSGKFGKKKSTNPIEKMADDRIKEKEETLRNDEYIVKMMKEKGMDDFGGMSLKELEERIAKNKEYLKTAKAPQKDSISDDDVKRIQDKIKTQSETSKPKSSLPQKTEIKEQGNSNRLAVKENIQAHILEFYDDPQDFIDTMDNMSHLSSDWKRGEEIAKGGTYLLYNQDMADFLDELKINPKGKKFSEDKAYEMYTSLIGRESANLYKRLKNEK